MKHDDYLKAEECMRVINGLNKFKKDLTNYMKDDDNDKKFLLQFDDARLIWNSLLSRFSKKPKNICTAPNLIPDDLNNDADELYKDLCAVADKWIDIYEKRLEEL